MLSARNISKKFAGVNALDQVSLDLLPGKVNAIIGENGAGKSTLMKILSGVYTEYEGQLEWNQEVVQFRNIRDAQDLGIAIIHQELNLIPELSIWENLFLGQELTNRFGLLDRGAMQKRSLELLQKLRLSLDPNTQVKTLKVGQQQLIEIAKALLADAKVIIMDEPSSAISGAEVEVLFEIIAELKKEGKTIVYISHKMDELFRIADCYTILRDGKTMASGTMASITPDEIVAKMVGREIAILDKSRKLIDRVPLLEVENLQLNLKGKAPEAPIAFTLHAGEILGVFGLMGAGRTELLECLFGAGSGQEKAVVKLQGQSIRVNSPDQALAQGLALVPEDRKKDGIFPVLSVQKNIGISTLSKLLKNGVLSPQKEASLAVDYINALQIKTRSPQQAIQSLSGGNQQKAILGRYLATRPKVLLLDEPTRGIDVNAKAEIYQLIAQFAREGLGILMASSELPELFAVCDRVLVLCEGKLNGDFPIQEASEETLLKAAIA